MGAMHEVVYNTQPTPVTVDGGRAIDGYGWGVIDPDGELGAHHLAAGHLAVASADLTVETSSDLDPRYVEQVRLRDRWRHFAAMPPADVAQLVAGADGDNIEGYETPTDLVAVAVYSDLPVDDTKPARGKKGTS